MEKLIYVAIAFDFIFFLIAVYLGWTSIIDIWDRLSPPLKMILFLDLQLTTMPLMILSLARYK